MVGGFYGLYNLLPFIIELFLCDPDRHDRHLCGGSLISNSWVLTAGHCVHQKQAVIFLGAGRVSNSYRNKKYIKFNFHQKRRTGEIFLHDKYDHPGQFNDIALLKTRVPFQDSLDIFPIALPTKTEEVDLSQMYKYCYSGGWGISGYDNMFVYDHKKQTWTYNIDNAKPSQLVQVVLPLISQKQCKRLQYREILIGFDIEDTHICTLYYPGRKSLCRGDSGGPLVCGSKLYGISSWSYACGTPRIGGDVFTRVDKYIVWINETMKKNPNRRSIGNQDYNDIDFRTSSAESHNVLIIFRLIFHYLLFYFIM